MDFNTPVQHLPKIGPHYQKLLTKLEIYTLYDLLTHAPIRYDDFSKIVKINQIPINTPVTVIGEITYSKNIFTRSRKQIQKITITDDTGTLAATWFNQPFVVKGLPVGLKVAFAGKINPLTTDIQMTAPDYEIVGDTPLLHTGRLVPVYPQTEGISSKWLRQRIFSLLNFPDLLKEFLPPELIKKHNLLPLMQALHQLHFPESLDQVETARHRLAFEELFLTQISTQRRKNYWLRQKTTQAFSIDSEKTNGFIKNLPFKLTKAQQKVTQHILDDLQKSTAMNRLLQGDVGSGKTVVAAIAIYAAYQNKTRSLLMAPTEILAQQHFKTLTKLLEPFGITVGLQTGSHKSLSKNPPLRKRGLGGVKTPTEHDSDVIIGTHALLEDNIQLESVGLVIIDEQHRFGVRQRGLLRTKGHVPHVLTMTATPIPRTVVLTLYGDLDLSVIDELPQGRKTIKTWVVPAQKRTSAYDWIQKNINQSPRQQAFIVCPFIEISESMQSVKAAKVEFENLSTKIFPKLKLGLLHGKTKAEEKNKLLKDFHAGHIDILVATPVVEVGIDIPGATIMLIEAADRFGLAQLHQLRGRVGRNDLQSYCLLFTESQKPQTLSKLKALETIHTGHALAELDLQLRGPGVIYGTAQHGHALLKFANFSDFSLIETTKTEAEKLLKTDPELSNHPTLKQKLQSSTISEVTPD